MKTKVKLVPVYMYFTTSTQPLMKTDLEEIVPVYMYFTTSTQPLMKTDLEEILALPWIMSSYRNAQLTFSELIQEAWFRKDSKYFTTN